MPEVFSTMVDWLQSFIKTYKDEITAVGTLLIAFFTLVVACISRRQVKDSRINQRAYLAVEPRGIHPWKEGLGFHIVGHVGIKNAGRLAARNVRWSADMQFSSDQTFRPPDPGKLDGPIVVPAGAVAIQGAPHKSDSDAYSHLYVWGIVEYRDGFSKRKRWTRFCHRYNCESFRNLAEGGRKIPSKYGRYHIHGNSTDED